jgi:hypothetical protein
VTEESAGLDLCGSDWEKFLTLTADMQHGVLHVLSIEFGSYVNANGGARLDESCSANLLVQLQEGTPTAWLIRFRDVRAIEVDVRRDAAPARLRAEGSWSFDMLNFACASGRRDGQ